MTSYCNFHKKEHDHYRWKTWIVETNLFTVCKDGLEILQHPPTNEGKGFLTIGGSKKDIRMSHWRDIESRITTHEGELLSGKAGKDYQKKYSRQYLGRDLSKPTNYSTPSFQKELAKTR